MLSPEVKAKAEENLKQVNEEIAALSHSGFDSSAMGAEYLKHLHRHRDLWMKFLGR